MLKRVVAVVEVLALAGFIVFIALLFLDQPEKTQVSAKTNNSVSSSSNGSGGAAAVDGAAIFDDRCSSCHGSKGQGGVGPKLNGGEVTKNFPKVDDELTVVKNGRSGMPAFGSRLSPEELQAVVEFTRTDLQKR